MFSFSNCNQNSRILLGVLLLLSTTACQYPFRNEERVQKTTEVQFQSTQWTVYNYNRSNKGCFDRLQKPGFHVGGLATECADFKNKNLTDMDFQGLNLMGSHFSGATGINISFKDANLMGAHLKGFLAKQVQWSGALFDEATELPFTRSEALLRGMVFKDLAKMDRDLLLKIQLGQVAEVKKLLELKADAFQSEALIFAIDHPTAYSELVRLLLDQGVSVDQLSGGGHSVLSTLIDRLSYSSKPEELITKIKFLLSLGADANAGANLDLGASALSRAVGLQHSSKELVELLFKAGANPNQKGKGCDPLVNEVRSPEVLKLFIDYGAEIAGTYYGGACNKKSRSYLMALLSDSKNFKLSQNISAQQFVQTLQMLDGYGYRITQSEKNQQGRSIFISAVKSLELDAHKMMLLSDSGYLLKLSTADVRQIVSETLESFYQMKEPTSDIETRVLEILDVAKKLNLDFEGKDSKHKSLLSRLLEQENIKADKIFLTYLKLLSPNHFKDTAMDNLTEKLLRRALKKPQLLSALEIFLVLDENINGNDRGGYPLINLCEKAECFFQFVDHGFDVSKSMNWERSSFLGWFLKNKFKLWTQSEKMQWIREAFQNSQIQKAFTQWGQPLIPWLYSLKLSNEFYRNFFQEMALQENQLTTELQKKIVCDSGEKSLQLHLQEILTQKSPDLIQLSYQLTSEDNRNWKVQSYKTQFEQKQMSIYIKTEEQNILFETKDFQNIVLTWGPQRVRSQCRLSPI